MFLENNPDHITVKTYDVPDISGKNCLTGGAVSRRTIDFAGCAGKLGLIGVFLISCILLYPVYCSQAETYKYIKIGENETSTRIVNAANLRYIKIGEHKSYTRIVFEFKEPVRYDTPVIQPGGKFSILFFDTTTALPRQISVDATERIGRIEFEQEESNLSVNVSMSFSQFRIKSFLLTKPDRLVIDVYRLENPIDIVPGNIVLQKMVFKASKYSPVAKGKVVQDLAVPEASADKGGFEPARIKNPPPEASPRPATISADTVTETEKVKKVRRKDDPALIVHTGQGGNTTAGDMEARAFTIDRVGKKGGGNDNLQVYLLPVLTALSVVIISLLVFIIFQKKKSVGLPVSTGRRDLLNTTDETIAAINAKINREIKKIKRA